MKLREKSVHVRNPNYDAKQGRLEQRVKLSSKWRWGIKDSSWEQKTGWTLRRYPRCPLEIYIKICTMAHGDAMCHVRKVKSSKPAKSQCGSHFIRLQGARRPSMWLIEAFYLSLRIYKNSCVLVMVDLLKLGKLRSLHGAISSSLSPNSLSCDSVIYLPMHKSCFLSLTAKLDFFLLQHEIYCLPQKHSANSSELIIYRCFPIPPVNVFSHYLSKIYYNSTSLTSLRKGM